MADQNKLKPYLYIIPCINSYINFDIKNQKLFMFCYKCTEFLLNVFWAPVLLCWAVVKLGGGHNCTTGPEKNIGVCRRMGGGGRLVPARARDRMRGSYPSPLQSTHTKFSDHGPATAGCCWDNKKQKKCPQRALLQKAVLCIVYGTIEAQAPAPLRGQCDTRGHGAVDSLFVLMEANTKKICIVS